MKLAAALILSFAVFAVVMADNQEMRKTKIPDEEQAHNPMQTIPDGMGMGQTATRRGGKGGKGESSPPPQGWGWGPPQHGGWGPPQHGGWGQPMVIPIPISVYRGGYGGGYGGGGY